MTNLLTLRPELYHPLFVHFPIACIVFALMTHVACLITQRKELRWVTTALLGVGLLSIGAALFTGDFAEDAVKGKLCNPHMLSEHEEHAYQTLYILLVAFALDAASHWVEIHKQNFLKATLWCTLVLLVCANLSLVIAAHHGAQLVYEQGAGVKNAKIGCTP